MKVSLIFIFAVLLVGCQGIGQSENLNPAQAETMAVWYANDKALALYGYMPFREDKPVSFTQGRWVWSDGRSFTNGPMHGHFQATVELAADGSTNSVRYFCEYQDDSIPGFRSVKEER
jgi:hypothetical protein